MSQIILGVKERYADRFHRWLGEQQETETVDHSIAVCILAFLSIMQLLAFSDSHDYHV